MDLESLNKEQLEAVQLTSGPLLILAGAGSGKTRVLTTRITYLIEHEGIIPSSILAITFTNKAAREMKSRVVRMLGPKAFQIQISTFHSFGLLILKEHYMELGYKENFTILDGDDSLVIIKKIMKDLGYDTKKFIPKAVRGAISSSKNELISAKEYGNYVNCEFSQVVEKVYSQYENKLKMTNSLDFDDLLILPIFLFRKFPDVLNIYQERFRYILIDEYQDTNQAQYILTKMISAKYQNLCVVGDADQSIFSWRGANYRNILNFEKDFPSAKLILLEENYRSTQTILNAANDVIRNNVERKEKNLWTNNEKGMKITYHRAYVEKDEAYYVTNCIRDLIHQGVSRDEIAILYRTNVQSRNMEEYLLRENIPYKVVGSFYFYNRREVKDLIAYLRLIYNPYDDTSLLRVINVPKRGIGLKSLERLTMNANGMGRSLYEVIQDGKELEFKKLIEIFREKVHQLSLTELVDFVLDKSGIREELIRENTIESEVRLENLEEFKSITRNFEEKYGIISLSDFLMEISLVADVEEHKDFSDVVTLMTIHSAKGLEFNYVFLVGMEEGIFPHNTSILEGNLEEERRLCYVAITRARKNLWFINAKRRLIYGVDSCNPPSRFIKEIHDEYLHSDVIEEKDMSTFSHSDSFDYDVDYVIGDKIVQDLYGMGVIVGVDDKFLSIAFSHPYGIKKFMKGHKSIRKV